MVFRILIFFATDYFVVISIMAYFLDQSILVRRYDFVQFTILFFQIFILRLKDSILLPH